MLPWRRFPRDEDVVFAHQFGEQLCEEVNLQQELHRKHRAELCKSLAASQPSSTKLPNLYCKELSNNSMASLTKVDSLKEELEDMRRRFSILEKRAQRSLSYVVNQGDNRRIKTNKPSIFYGKKDQNILELWLFSVEQYDDVMGITDESDMILFTTIYLKGYVTDWWMEYTRVRGNKLEFAIHRWAAFRELMEKEFTPMNATWQFREQWYKIQQVGKVRDYIVEYRLLMLSIKDKSDLDWLIQFGYCLKPVIREEVEKQEPTTLNDATCMVDKLEGYEFEQRAFSKSYDSKSNNWNHDKRKVYDNKTTTNFKNTSFQDSVKSQGSNNERKTNFSSTTYRKQPHTKNSLNENSNKLNNPSKTGPKCFNCNQFGNLFYDCPMPLDQKLEVNIATRTKTPNENTNEINNS